jgi:hypothetical protein
MITIASTWVRRSLVALHPAATVRDQFGHLAGDRRHVPRITSVDLGLQQAQRRRPIYSDPVALARIVDA